jgi:hypothetical protein
MSPARRAPRRAAKRVPPPPAFPQAQGGSARQRLLFELVRARATFMAAIHGLTAASAERPLGPGRWCIREIALHLVARDRARLRELEGARQGRRASWIGLSAAESARMNEDDLAPLRAHGWDETLRLLQITRQQLMEVIEALPAEPADAWEPAHPFGEMLHLLPAHDRHHAAQVKDARLAPR